jgi:hypothetical protein
VTEQLDGSPESIILESVLEGMAEYYSRNLVREVMKGMKENAYQAKFCGGTPPLGYDIVEGNNKDMIKHYLSRYATALKEKKNADDLKEVIDALVDTVIVQPEGGAKINFRFFGAEVSTLNGSGEGI